MVICKLCVVRSMLQHLLKCTRVSLERGQTNLQHELKPKDALSPGAQADLLDETVRWLSRGVDLVKNGQCENEKALSVLSCMKDF